MRDKIRTRDLLVRSQTLYPAELPTHSVALSATNSIVQRISVFVNTLFTNSAVSVFCFSIKMIFAGESLISGTVWLNFHDSWKQFRRTALSIYFRQQIIHLREKNIAGPTEKSKTRKRFLVRRGGPAFFDEDDVCSGLRTCGAVCLNCPAIRWSHIHRSVCENRRGVISVSGIRENDNDGLTCICRILCYLDRAAEGSP